jgi:hypothetical protein
MTNGLKVARFELDPALLLGVGPLVGSLPRDKQHMSAVSSRILSAISFDFWERSRKEVSRRGRAMKQPAVAGGSVDVAMTLSTVVPRPVGLSGALAINGVSGGRTFDGVDVQSGLCLDVIGAATADDALVELWTRNGGSSQQWTFG